MSENNTGSGLGIILGALGILWLVNYLNKKKCSRCQYENPPETNFCYNCGGPL